MSCGNILSYGGVGDGTTDNTAAFTAAVTASPCVSFPPGKFRFNSALGYTFTADLQSLTIRGEGPDQTVLYWPNTVGTALAVTKNQLGQSVHLRDLSMTTGTFNDDVGFSSVQVRNFSGPIQGGYASNDITNVTFRADEGYWEENAGSPTTISHGWKTGILLKDSVWNITGVSIYGPTPTGSGGYPVLGAGSGTGIDVETVNTNILPALFNITTSNFTWLENGLLTGAHAQGFQVAQSNFVGCYIGIKIPSGATSITQVSVTGSQLNNIHDIDVAFPVAVLTLGNNLFYVPTGGIGINTTAQSLMTTITGNVFNGPGAGSGIGISLNPNSTDIAPPVITGNNFYSIGTGISIGANEFGLVTANNVFTVTTNNVVSTSPYGQNSVTGSTANMKPMFSIITGVANNGSGMTRITVPTTAGFFNGQMVLAGGTTGTNPGLSAGENVASSIVVIDSTHIDLTNVQFGGAYTSGGYITTYP